MKTVAAWDVPFSLASIHSSQPGSSAEETADDLMDQCAPNLAYHRAYAIALKTIGR